ncbi:unnamed protein product [Sphagnum balticum]
MCPRKDGSFGVTSVLIARSLQAEGPGLMDPDADLAAEYYAVVGSFESLADRKRRPLLGVVERRVGSRTGLSVFFVGGQFGCLRELGAPVLAEVLLDEAEVL